MGCRVERNAVARRATHRTVPRGAAWSACVIFSGSSRHDGERFGGIRPSVADRRDTSCSADFGLKRGARGAARSPPSVGRSSEPTPATVAMLRSGAGDRKRHGRQRAAGRRHRVRRRRGRRRERRRRIAVRIRRRRRGAQRAIAGGGPGDRRVRDRVAELINDLHHHRRRGRA